MNEKLLDDIELNFDIISLLKQFSITSNSAEAKKMKKITKEASKLAKPKGLYKTSFIKEKGEDYIILEEKKLKSQILRDNLDSAEKVYPYIVTCGREL